MNCTELAVQNTYGVDATKKEVILGKNLVQKNTRINQIRLS